MTEDFFETLDEITSSISSQDQNKFGDFIFDLTKEFYSNLTNSFKPDSSQWTVYASVILQNKNEFKVITFANGTKSLPNKNYKNKDFVIYDSHAEVLALRALKIVLAKILIFNFLTLQNNSESNPDKNLTNSQNSNFLENNYNTEEYRNKYMTKLEYSIFLEHKNFFSIFEIKSDNKKIKLKNDVYFHLYISESPCGDCSIYPLQSDTNQTGAKTIEEVVDYFQSTRNKMTHDNTPGKFRSKSMRSDTIKTNVSLSLSCSDKILVKNTLGIQGKFLSEILELIYISSIVISTRNETEGVVDAIRRGVSLPRRLKYTTGTHFELGCSEPVIVVTNQFLDSGVKSDSNVNALSYSAYWYYGKSNLTKVDPTTGLKQGTNLSNVNFTKNSVDVSGYELFNLFVKILEIYSEISKDVCNNSRLNKVIRRINKLVNEQVEEFDFNNKSDARVENVKGKSTNITQERKNENNSNLGKYNSEDIKYKKFKDKLGSKNYKKIKNKIKEMFQLNHFLNLKLGTK